MLACRLPNFDGMIEVLLKKGANVNLRNRGGWTVLMKAVKDGRVDIVKCLLEKGGSNIDLELQNKESATALMIACRQGNLQVIELLLANGANVNVVGEEQDPQYGFEYKGKSPLVIAIMNDHSEVAKLLLLKGAKDNEALRAACLKKDLDLVKRLLEAKVEVDYKSDGETPLMIACRLKRSDIVEELLKNGAKVGLHIHNKAESALMIAVRCSSKEVVEKILAYATVEEVDAKTKKGNTALMIVWWDGSGLCSAPASCRLTATT
jgi:serine/threonine-protein phosphatase 6 regulatory ankyrin repeat subunit B